MRKRPDQTETDKRTTTTIRLLESELDAIKKRASTVGMTLTDYMLRKALGQVTGDESYEQRLQELERAVKRLNDVAQLGSFE